MIKLLLLIILKRCWRVLAIDKLLLNLGCGEQLYGTHRVDIHETKATTHIFDVEEGLSFPNEFFNEVYEK